MTTEVIMPQLGESVIEGTVSKWLKTKGDAVSEYEPLLEINTDKVDSEIPSPAAGILLDILVPEGATVNAGTVLALIGANEDLPQSAADGPALSEVEGSPTVREGASPQPKRDRNAASTGNGGAAPPPSPWKGDEPGVRVGPGESATQAFEGKPQDLGFISPVVAKIASEEGIDLAQVPGTGQGGRITKKDVLAYLDRLKVEGEQVKGEKAVAEEAPTPLLPSDAPDRRSPAPPPPSDAPDRRSPAALPGETIPLTAVRRAIAEHMVHSKHTSPHVTTVMEADLSRVVAHRQVNKEAYARSGANLTYTPYLISAIVSALKAFPIVNSSWSEEGIVLHNEINIGMATSLGESGLIVPVIKNADGLSLLGLARAVNDLANRARARQLRPEEVKGGTFTLTNHGTSGSLFATPIINQPQCGILGVGAIQKRVIVTDNDAIAIRPMAYISLTFDHRILDGAIADYFLGKVVELLQSWDES
jgi:2-oxoglutarate dehydrogenase E2 component (dihydrolipoamide succinyltransferase)